MKLIHNGTKELQQHQKHSQKEKIAPYIFKINDTQTRYLDKEKITYEIYHKERKIKTN